MYTNLVKLVQSLMRGAFPVVAGFEAKTNKWEVSSEKGELT